MNSRRAEVKRKTKETDISLDLVLDGSGQIEVNTGIGFLDHLLKTLAFHAGFDIKLSCEGDLDVDDHHTAEDCGLALGQALREALGEKKGIGRFGSAYAPLDEALARAVVDLSGRPFSHADIGLEGPSLGGLSSENVGHVINSFALESRSSIHVDVIRGENDHHRAEAAFKALALALREAVCVGGSQVPSTKGAL